MQAALSAEQLAQVWEKAGELQRYINLPNLTKDRWGEPFAIFEGWGDVKLVRDIVCELFPAIAADYPRLSGDYPHIDCMIGEFGFSDQYCTCDHCYIAIDHESANPDFWYDDTGGVLCGDCLRSNDDFADDYLSYMARKLESEGNGLQVHGIDPESHGFVCLNRGDRYCTVDQGREDYHPSFPSGLYGLSYAGWEAAQRLAKAARLIDSDLQIVFEYSGGSTIYWVRFDPNANLEFAAGDAGGAWGLAALEEIDGSNLILGYAITRTLAKYEVLSRKAGKV